MNPEEKSRPEGQNPDSDDPYTALARKVDSLTRTPRRTSKAHPRASTPTPDRPQAQKPGGRKAHPRSNTDILIETAWQSLTPEERTTVPRAQTVRSLLDELRS